MSRNKTHRPRIRYETRDRITELASQINGEEPDGFHHSLQLLIRYFEALEGNVECPECGATDVGDYSAGMWRCWRCEEDRDTGIFNLFAYIEPANEEEARLPGTERTAQAVLDKIEESNQQDATETEGNESGTDANESPQHAVNQEPLDEKFGNERWQDTF